jgi:hypothetical protein
MRNNGDRSIGVLICDDVESIRLLLGVVVRLRAGSMSSARPRTVSRRSARQNGSNRT